MPACQRLLLRLWRSLRLEVAVPMYQHSYRTRNTAWHARRIFPHRDGIIFVWWGGVSAGEEPWLSQRISPQTVGENGVVAGCTRDDEPLLPRRD